MAAEHTGTNQQQLRDTAKELSEGFKKCAGVRGVAEKILQVCDRTE